MTADRDLYLRLLDPINVHLALHSQSQCFPGSSRDGMAYLALIAVRVPLTLLVAWRRIKMWH